MNLNEFWVNVKLNLDKCRHKENIYVPCSYLDQKQSVDIFHLKDYFVWSVSGGCYILALRN
jgi:hypothetical protein